jgi:hypothetical protein
MAGITTYLSILVLNVTGLHTLIKRHHFANWIKRKTQKSVVYKRPTLLTEINTGLREEIYQANALPK